MTNSKSSALPESVLALWEQWKVVVDLFVRRNMARHHLKNDVYQDLHYKLLELCDEGSDEDRHSCVRRIANVVRPWRSLSSLNEAPAKILTDLWGACQAVDREIYGAHRGKAKGPLSTVFVFGTMFVSMFVATLVLLLSSDRANQGRMTGIIGLSIAVTNFVTSLGARGQFVLAVVLCVVFVALLAMFAMQSARKF